MEIKLNGRNRSVTAVTAGELCDKSDLAHSYIIINGYSAVPATRLNAGDEVFVIPKTPVLTVMNGHKCSMPGTLREFRQN